MRFFTCYTASAEDLEKVKSLQPRDCPRRYCWWWKSLQFEWNLPVAEGCTFLKEKKSVIWPHPDVPCRRADAASDIDHYQPREPHAEEDGVDYQFFLGRKNPEAE